MTGERPPSATPPHFAPQVCPAAEVWFALCAGQIDSKQAEPLVAHAVDCAHCGALLKEATLIWSENPSPAEEGTIAQLRSSGEEWQRELAAQLTRESRKRSLARMSRAQIRHYFWPIVAAAVAATIFAAIWIHNKNHSPDTLLAQAYDQQRLTALRIPGGNPVPLYSPVRGSAATQESPQLLEVRLAAEKGLQEDSTSAHWHQVLGRIDVIEMQSESALAQFQLAETRDPSLPRIQFDLGTAYFELGEGSGDPTNYGYAAEHFSRYLDSVNGRDPVALYNRALCWQRTGVQELARKDLNEAIKLERNPDWRRAMEQTLHSLDSAAPPSSKSQNQLPPGTPRKEDNFENQLRQAIDDQIANPSPQTLDHLQPVAELGEKHRDFWLADWITASRRHRSRSGDAALSASIHENLAGDSSEGLAVSIRAQNYYRAVANMPGVLRAQAEEIYGLRRVGRAQDCLVTLDGIQRVGELRRYPYLSTSLRLQKAVCLAMVGQFELAQTEAHTGFNLATTYDFPSLALRATSFLAGFWTDQGLAEDGWKGNVAGLRGEDHFSSAPMQHYQFLSDLTLDASAMGLIDVAAQLADESAQISTKTGNVQIAAYAAEMLGKKDVAAKRLGDAVQAFTQADKQLNQLGNREAVRLYRADWSVDRAELELYQGDRSRALFQLDNAISAVEGSRNLLIELNYWTRRAQLESAANDIHSAVASATKAINYADTALENLHALDERRAWQYSARDAYLTLVGSLAEAQRSDDALKAWLHFRGATEVSPASPTEPLSQVSLPGMQGSTVRGTVIYVQLADRYLVFVPGTRGADVQVKTLHTSRESLDQMVRTFSILCADPRSRLADIKSLGTQLYSILITPILPLPPELRIDASGALDQLPFGALVTPEGNYLAFQLPIVQLPEFWATHIPSHPFPISAEDKLLLADVPEVFNQGIFTIPQSYDESSQLHNRFPHITTLDANELSAKRLVEKLNAADIFHFVGHAIAEGSSSDLVLGSPISTSALLLTPSSLDGNSLPHCHLVVLAACSTMGDEPHRLQEPFALPAAFLRSGADDVVATRWDVDSEAARDFVIKFYDEVLEGKSPALALMKAEENVWARSQFRHPYYWAPFSLVEQQQF